MQKVTRKMLVEKACELIKRGVADRCLAWKRGEFSYDVTPFVFNSQEEIDKEFEFNDFCGVNLSKYLIKETKKEGRILVFLKPCDSYSFNQLLTEHRLKRDNVYIVGVACDGMLDINEIKARTDDAINAIESDGESVTVKCLGGDTVFERTELLSSRCKNCKSKHIAAYDELIGENGETQESERFKEVERIEAMTPDERFLFWQGELSRCIRCNACRDVCPACTCEKCVFDNPKSGFENKAAADSFEEKMFHIIRAFHVAGRCTDCGECSRACPQNIPLHLLNRKFIKDINSFYGEYQAGEKPNQRSPLVNYSKDDREPNGGN